MTVIAWDGKSVAADRKIGGDGGPCGVITKLHDLPGGGVAAVCGSAASAFALLRWKRGEVSEFPRDFGSVGKLIVFGDGNPLVYDSRNEVPLVCEDEFMAWGSGALAAVGALAHGATSSEAVEIASRFCDGCGNGIDVRHLRG